MNLFDRFLLALYSLSLIIVLFAAGLVVAGWTTPLDLVQLLLVHTEQRFILEAVIIVFLLISVRFLYQALLHDRQPVQAVVQDTDLGQVRVSLDAIENMVMRVTSQVAGVSEVRPKVKCLPEGISIFVRVILSPETNIPLTSDEIQVKVGNYVSQVAGISVKSIKILVDGVSSEKNAGMPRRLN